MVYSSRTARKSHPYLDPLASLFQNAVQVQCSGFFCTRTIPAFTMTWHNSSAKSSPTSKSDAFSHVFGPASFSHSLEEKGSWQYLATVPLCHLHLLVWVAVSSRILKTRFGVVSLFSHWTSWDYMTSPRVPSTAGGTIVEQWVFYNQPFKALI